MDDDRARLGRSGRSLAALGLLAAVILLALASAGSQAASAQMGARLVSLHSGKCLDIHGASQANLAPAIQWACHGGNNQTVQVSALGDGFYQLRVAHSNRCLEVMHWSRDNGAPIGQYACHGGDNQRWSGQFLHGAAFVVQNKFSGKCIDVHGWGGGDGNPLVQWDCHHGANQQWRTQSFNAEATGLRVASQVCGGNGRVNAALAWMPSNRGPQWADLSLQNNGFAPGSFAAVGPLPAAQSELTWNNLQPGARHYLRVNTATSAGWRASATLVFDTRTDCGGGGGPAAVVRTLNTTQRVVALTFDGGADAGYTQMILDTLQQNGIKADFGITGRWAELYPHLIKRIAADGHGLINHSYDHSSFTGLSTGQGPLSATARASQLNRTEEIILGLTGRSTKPYFRPPYGDYDASVNTDVGALGYRYNVMWSVDSGGWRGWPAQMIVNHVVANVSPGGIVIFHVGSAAQDGPALQAIIDRLREMGYGFVSIEDYLN